nr:apolipoprotein M [Misgurnus anguillicaudatus]
MLSTFLSVVGLAGGLFYAGLESMIPCIPPAPLSTAVLSTDQYMGSWYFVAAAAWDEDGIRAFNGTDSSVLDIQKEDNTTLKVSERWRIGDTCHSNSWNYMVHSVTDPLMFRDDFDAIAMIWDGSWINCPSCIVILMVDDDEEISAMLFSRDEKTSDKVMEEFKSKTECVLMEDLIKAPVTKDYCK